MRTFIDIDTQIDFMNKDGALYVPGAEEIKPNLSRLTEYALKNSIKIMSTSDRHLEEDKELLRNGGPFPDHCMTNTYGAYKIPETRVPVNAFEGGPYWKRCCDIFDSELGSEQFEIQLRLLKITEAIVYGVATDYCIKAAVLGLLKRGIKVTVVEDAIKGVGKNSTSDAMEEMVKAGALIGWTHVITGWKQ